MSGKLTVTGSDLVTVLWAAMPFAGRDDTLPALSCIRMEARDKAITATATDRYTIGHARASATGGLARPVLISRRDAKNIIRVLRRSRDDERIDLVEVTVTQADSHIQPKVTFATNAVSVTVDDHSRTFQYPDLKTIMDALATAGTASLDGMVAVDPRHFRALLKVQRLAGAGHPCRFYFGGARKPVRVEFGDWFVGAIMPTKISDQYLSATGNVPFGFPPPAEKASPAEKGNAAAATAPANTAESTRG